ncbi:hypothetical protein CDAR_167331 [Caerostris darwini]|uniref:Uncharacterized protein n=1 Tax=Caerostris darwini TaxID=1538125 RepID=A0AAV4VZC2_9ARAC|nr:hypothetical protein CDAR_167331 [Caerostris darwini]
MCSLSSRSKLFSKQNRTFQQVLERACSELQLVQLSEIILLFIKEAFSVPTCKPTIVLLDDSIIPDGKGTTWSRPIIPEEDFYGCWFEVFILEEISEEVKVPFDIGTSEVPSLAKRLLIFWPRKVPDIDIQFNMRRDR